MVVGFDITNMHPSLPRTKTHLPHGLPSFQGHAAYHEGPANQALDAAYQRFSVRLDKAGYDDQEYNSHNLYKRDPLLVAAVMNEKHSPLKSVNALQNIETMLTEMPCLEAAFVSGGLSRICNWDRIASDVESIREAFGKRFTWDIWLRDSHSMGITEQQPRMVAFFKQQVIARLQS